MLIYFKPSDLFVFVSLYPMTVSVSRKLKWFQSHWWHFSSNSHQCMCQYTQNRPFPVYRHLFRNARHKNRRRPVDLLALLAPNLAPNPLLLQKCVRAGCKVNKRQSCSKIKILSRSTVWNPFMWMMQRVWQQRQSGSYLASWSHRVAILPAAIGGDREGGRRRVE